MVKCFNVTQKERRAQIADRKRTLYGDPATGKLKKKPQSLYISGKRKRKLLKRWRRKEAMEKGLVIIQDVEMATADGTSQEAKRAPAKFHLKKSVKLKAKQRKQKGKTKNKTTNSAAGESEDAMVE
ncbi:hypothetical protein Ancab_009578 [Ancistrocladus abbreviatus]